MSLVLTSSYILSKVSLFKREAPTDWVGKMLNMENWKMKVNSCQTCFYRFNILYNISVAWETILWCSWNMTSSLKWLPKNSSERSTKKYVHNIPQWYVILMTTLHYIEDCIKTRPSKPWITLFISIHISKHWLAV